MSLFTTLPVSLVDSAVQPIATLDSALSISFRCQLPDAKSVVGEYVISEDEPTGVSPVLLIKHQESKTVKRSLASLKIDALTADDTYAGITVNLSVVNDRKHSDSQVVNQLEVMRCLMGTPGFLQGICDGMVG